MAGKSTLNRLELSRPEATRYHKISYEADGIETLFVDLFLEAFKDSPKRSSWTWTPPTTHCTAIRRAGSSTAITIATATCRSTSSVTISSWRRNCGPPASMEQPVRRRKWPVLSRKSASAGRWCALCCVLIRGFARDELMGWCEANGVDYIFGLARNTRLVAEIADELAQAQQESSTTGQPARRFKDFVWRTRTSWSRERRVIAKAEWTQGQANPRFIVTTLGQADGDSRKLYETLYCARGEMENRIKECQLDLFADRTSTATMRANQLRLWFASMAYVLVANVRRRTAGNRIRQCHLWHHPAKLLKIGALVRISVRRVKLAMASACPWQHEFALAHAMLRNAAA